VQSWDTANKATELSDFSVCTTWGIRGKNLYLLGLLRQRLEYPALKRAVREQQNLFDATEVLIEDKASGTQLIQELIADGCHRVTRYQPTTDKTMRLNAQTAIIENGFVYIPETAPWLAEYLHEMTVFPNGKHDDQVDSTAQFLDWFKRPYPGQGIFEYYRKMAEKFAAAGSGLRPPRGATRDRRGPNFLRPTHHHRRGSHRRDVRRRCQLSDPCRLDQARRMKLRRCRLTCRDVNRQSPRLCEPLCNSGPGRRRFRAWAHFTSAKLPRRGRVSFLRSQRCSREWVGITLSGFSTCCFRH